MKPLVSILIPAHNAQQWIASSIESALRQTWPYKEIIVVDDGSTDQTLQTLEKYTSKGVKVIAQSNQGASGARNTAFSSSTGDYIQWFDADDLLAPDKIERQIAMLAQFKGKRVLLSGAWGYFFYRQRKATFSPTALWCDLTPTEYIFRKIGLNLHMQPDVWLVSRELTEAAGPWNTRLWRDNDGEYFCRVIMASDEVRFVPDARSYYRRSGSGSITFIGRSNKKLDSLLLSMKLHVGYMLDLENSPRTRQACLTYIHNWVWSFYPRRPDILAQLEQLAASLGGTLTIPELSWKYSWLHRILGPETAKSVQDYLPRVKESWYRGWDKVMFRWENQKPHGEPVERGSERPRKEAA